MRYQPPTTTDSSPKKHRQWLQRQLALRGIDRDQLLATAILLERVIQQEQSALLQRTVNPPFYRLHKNDGTESRVWAHVAEAALWLDYRGYPAWDWFTAVCHWPPIRRRLKLGQQIPLNWFCPASRLDTGRLKRLEQFYLRWRLHRG